MSEQPEAAPPHEAEFARAWREGDPPMTQHVYPFREQPRAEVYIDGTWCRASVSMRQDSADGRIIYHASVFLPGQTSPSHRAVIWHPGSIRPRDGTERT